jgi:hypothetical protein
MNLKRAGAVTALYTGVLGATTVGVAYIVTRSGAVVLGLAGAGILLFVLGGANGGPVNLGTADTESAGFGTMSEELGVSGEKSRFLPTGTTNPLSAPKNVVMVFYGLGLFLWGLLLLFRLAAPSG